MRKVLALLKLAWLYVLYWLVGLTEEGFQAAKGNHLFELGHWAGAARAYERALEGTRSSAIHGALGWCWLYMDMADKSAAAFGKALETRQEPYYELGFAFALNDLGERQRCRAIVDRLRALDLPPSYAAELARLHEHLAEAEQA